MKLFVIFLISISLSGYWRNYTVICTLLSALLHKEVYALLLGPRKAITWKWIKKSLYLLDLRPLLQLQFPLTPLHDVQLNVICITFYIKFTVYSKHFKTGLILYIQWMWPSWKALLHHWKPNWWQISAEKNLHFLLNLIKKDCFHCHCQA